MDDAYLENYRHAREAAFQTLCDLAKDPRNSEGQDHHWSLELTHPEGDVVGRVVALLVEKGVIPEAVDQPHMRYPWIRQAVRETFHDAVSRGLIIPGSPRQSMTYSSEFGAFYFTVSGLSLLRDTGPFLMNQGSLQESLEDARQDGVAIEDHTVALIDEAQRCFLAHCYRASVVLIGLANEQATLDLCDALSAGLTAPNDADLLAHFRDVSAQAAVFSVRWKACLALLAAVRRDYWRNRQHRGQPWRGVLDGLPNSLASLGEPVRYARNQAAHEADREFSKAEVAVLLMGLPSQLRLLSDLMTFISAPPIPLPQL